MNNPLILIELIGFLAGICTTISFLPQVIKIYQTKSTESISLGMYIIYILGVSLWMTYGYFIHSLSVMVANFLTLILAGWVLLMKLKWK